MILLYCVLSQVFFACIESNNECFIDRNNRDDGINTNLQAQRDVQPQHSLTWHLSAP